MNFEDEKLHSALCYKGHLGLVLNCYRFTLNSRHLVGFKLAHYKALILVLHDRLEIQCQFSRMHIIQMST